MKSLGFNVELPPGLGYYLSRASHWAVLRYPRNCYPDILDNSGLYLNVLSPEDKEILPEYLRGLRDKISMVSSEETDFTGLPDKLPEMNWRDFRKERKFEDLDSLLETYLHLVRLGERPGISTETIRWAKCPSLNPEILKLN